MKLSVKNTTKLHTLIVNCHHLHLHLNITLFQLWVMLAWCWWGVSSRCLEFVIYHGWVGCYCRSSLQYLNYSPLQRWAKVSHSSTYAMWRWGVDLCNTRCACTLSYDQGESCASYYRSYERWQHVENLCYALQSSRVLLATCKYWATQLPQDWRLINPPHQVCFTFSSILEYYHWALKNCREASFKCM